MPLPGPTHIPPIGEQVDPDQARVAAVVGGQLASAPARGFGLTPQELAAVQAAAAGDYQPAGDYPVATAQTRSRIVNGAMQISQENGNTVMGPATALGQYHADQWQTASSTSPGTASAQRVQVITPNGSKDRFRVTVGTAKAALAAGDYMIITTAIEGVRVADFRYGLASAKQSILRFGWKAPAGTYSIAFNNSAGNRTYLTNFTVSAGQANTDTEQTLVIPGDVTGTWLTDTGRGITLVFGIAVGTTYQGAAGWGAGNLWATASNTNGMATAGNVFELFDVGLYLDPDATGLAPKWAMPDEAQELAACQRYWQRVFMSFAGQVTNATGYYGTAYYAVPMRTAPALAATNAAASGFPSTPGTPANQALGLGGTYAVTENRTASATTTIGYFQSSIGANARM